MRQLFFLCLLSIIFSSEGESQDFQQEINFEIYVTLDDTRHELSAFQRIQYINNSPDTLGFLFFNLWPNAWSGNDTGLAQQLLNSEGRRRLFEDPDLRGYIDSLDFRIDGQPVTWKLLSRSPDVCRISLNEPVMPEDTIYITTPFRVKIPGGEVSQLGHIGESYQITHWYPQPALYDKSGWHPMPWLDMPSTPSVFGSFDVTITLPENYVVGATGNLQSEDEIRWLNKLAADNTWKRTHYYGGTRFPASSPALKNIRFTSFKTPGFAWFADKRFNVMKGRVMLPQSGREVTTWIMFTNLQARYWINATEYVNSSLLYFSENIGDYPYDTYTAVQSTLGAGPGHGYPGISVIGFETDGRSFNETVAGGIAANWIRVAPGTNRSTGHFIEEGVTGTYTSGYLNERYPVRKLWETYLNSRRLAEFMDVDTIPMERIYELRWLGKVRRNLEKPMDLPGSYYYREGDSDIYNYKATRGFDYLRAYLGDSLFDSLMQSWYKEYNYRHTQPGDLQSVFESGTKKNLSWFFNDYFCTTKKLDYKIVRHDNHQVLVENNADLVSPLVIAGMKGDSVIYETWVDGFEGRKWIDLPPVYYSNITIDPGGVMPEIYRTNNTVRYSGILPRLAPVRTRFLFNIDDPGHRTIVYLPLINWTRESGFMPGIALHNGFPLPKPVEYFISPFYSVKNNAIAGSGQLLFNITPSGSFFRLAKITLEGTRFGAPGDQNYHKLKGGLDIHLRSGNIRNNISQSIYGHYIAASDLYAITLPEMASMTSFLHIGYELENKRLVNPFNLRVFTEIHESYQKVSAEVNYRYSYSGEDNGLDIRLFAGAMMKNNSRAPFHSLAAGGRSGRENYLYGGTYPDRFSRFSETFFSRQMTLQEGGLVSPVNSVLGYSGRLVSLSLESNLPGRAGWIPVKPFANILVDGNSSVNNLSSSFFYEAGLKAGIWDFFEIYFPLLVSENIGSIRGPLKDRIRFVLNLNTFNQLDPLGIMN